MTGGARLVGEVTVGGAKNSALKLMAASLLAEGRTELAAVPAILDVDIMGQVLSRMGCTVKHDVAAAGLGRGVGIDEAAQLLQVFGAFRGAVQHARDRDHLGVHAAQQVRAWRTP